MLTNIVRLSLFIINSRVLLLQVLANMARFSSEVRERAVKSQLISGDPIGFSA